MILDWEPLKRIGPFEFNTPIHEYIEFYHLVHVPEEDDDITGWATYTLPEHEIRIYTENRQIVSIACYEECLYHGRNMIGMEFIEAVSLLKATPDENIDIIYIDDEPQEVFELDEKEAQLWVKDGTIVTISCRAPCDE